MLHCRSTEAPLSFNQCFFVAVPAPALPVSSPCSAAFQPLDWPVPGARIGHARGWDGDDGVFLALRCHLLGVTVKNNLIFFLSFLNGIISNSFQFLSKIIPTYFFTLTKFRPRPIATSAASSCPGWCRTGISERGAPLLGLYLIDSLLSVSLPDMDQIDVGGRQL